MNREEEITKRWEGTTPQDEDDIEWLVNLARAARKGWALRSRNYPEFKEMRRILEGE